MSLRVLLADESASIKKVFQLGLQDYAAEVKTVQSGVDVIEVAEQFSPDIIFADILLQKQNGYDVCEEIKKHESLKKVPFVLMWSSFMELDQGRFHECHADGEIEKPFEVDALRNHIKTLVNRTSDQQIASFLDFPSSINQDFIDEEKERAANPPKNFAEIDEAPASQNSVIFMPPPVEEEEEAEISSVFNQPDFELAPEDDELPLVSETAPSQVTTDPKDFTEWEVKPEINSLRQENPMEVPMEITPDEWQSTQLTTDTNDNSAYANEAEANVDGFASLNLDSPNDKKLDINEFLYKPGEEVVAPDSPLTAEKIAVAEVRIRDLDEQDGVDEEVSLSPSELKKAVMQSLPMDEIEAIVRAHTQELIKLNIQDQLPQIIERIARQELDKLLKDELATKASLGGSE